MKIKIGMEHIGGLCGVLFLAGCTGMQGFTTAARPGETIAVAAGWQQGLTRNNLTVTITPQSGPIITYGAGDYRIRTVVQGYPDPVSKIVVSDRANITYAQSGFGGNQTEPNPIIYNNLSPSIGNFTRNLTGGENDWSQTFVYIDLPTTIASGDATIQLTSNGNNLLEGTTIEILPLTASGRNLFPMSTGINSPIRGAERAPHYTVRFTGPVGVIPHSIQAEFSRTLSASGNAWVTHPRGDIQSTMWSDTGSLIKVMLTPVKGTSVDRLSDFKFYVTGAVTSLTTNSIKAYDIAGNQLPGFTASIQFVNN